MLNHRNMKVYRGTGGIYIGRKRSPSSSGHYPHEFISRYKLVRSDLSKLLCSLWLSLRNAYTILVVESEDVRLLVICEDVIKMDLVA